MNKIDKLDKELEKAREKAAEWQAKIRELEKQKQEEENSQIVQAKKNIEESGLSDQITLIEGDALDVDVDGMFDCIFIDAAKAQYRRFFEKYCIHLNENGIIVSDNMNFHGLVEHPELSRNRNTRQLVRKIHDYHTYLAELSDYETAFYDYGDGVAITRRK